MSEPELFTDEIDTLLENRDSSITSIFVASTPSPNIQWLSLQGQFHKTMEHRSKDRHRYPVSIPVGRLKDNVKRHGARATVTLGIFRLLNDARTWKTWGVENVQVREDLGNHEVTVEFGLVLDSDAVGVESFNYTVDLYLGY